MDRHSPSVSCCGICIGLFGITEMNERIKELLKQAGFTVARGWGLKDTVPEDVFIANVCVSNEIEKFAELIVRECAELIDNKVTITAAQTYDEVFVAKYDTKELCANQIREHFGVDE
jgi:hypothetical protein